ncbi:MAG: hypothetical protein P4L73_19105 [Caulobacteraceae bacterium]|nr:hypothetical protein [Caulobacteraceae bacterium]
MRFDQNPVFTLRVQLPEDAFDQLIDPDTSAPVYTAFARAKQLIVELPIDGGDRQQVTFSIANLDAARLQLALLPLAAPPNPAAAASGAASSPSATSAAAQSAAQTAMSNTDPSAANATGVDTSLNANPPAAVDQR